MSRSEDTLEELCERITVGHVGKMSDQYVDHGGVVFLRSQDVKPFTISRDTAKRVRAEFAERLRKSELRAGDVVVVRTGYPGTAAVVPEELHGSNCADLVVITPGPGLDAHFLAGVFNSVFGQRLVAGRLVGAAQQHFNVSAAKSLRLQLLPYPKQKQSGTAIAQICELIENNQRRIEILEEMARLIYREWFVHFRLPRHEDVKLVDSDLGPIPEGWDVTPASTAFEVNPRERVNNDAVSRFLTMGDLSETGMVCWPSELKPGTSGAKFRNGDTLFARITPCLENGKTGFVACLDDGEIGRGSTEFVVLRGAAVGPEFTYLTAREDSFRENAIKSMTGASGRQRVRNECFDTHLLVVPTAEVEREFHESVRPMFELVFSLARQNQVLADARDLLLPRLMSGELDVSDLDLDLEPVA